MCFSSFCLQELSKAFADDARDTKKTQLLLSANVGGLRAIVDRSYEVIKVAP